MSAVQRLAKLAQRARHKVGGMPSVVRRNRPSSPFVHKLSQCPL